MRRRIPATMGRMILELNQFAPRARFGSGADMMGGFHGS